MSDGITIAIPYHSNPNLLETALSSVVKQSVPFWDCVVCDDSKQKDAAAIVERLKHPQITYARNPAPAGMVSNWNFALSQGSYPYVTLFHADDKLAPNYVEVILNGIRIAPDSAAYFCRAEVIDPEGKRVFSFPDWIKRWLMPSRTREFSVQGESGAVGLLRGQYVFCPTLCFQRNLAREFTFNPNYSMVQDLDFLLRILLQGHSIRGLPSAAYLYRRHTLNASHFLTQNLKRFEEEISLYKNSALLFEQKGWSRASLMARRRTIIKLHLAYQIVSDLLGFRAQNLYRKWQLLLEND